MANESGGHAETCESRKYDGETWSANIGCFIGNIYVGCMAYADDLTLLAPTASAMHLMLDICSQFAADYSVSFNASKSKCLLFKPRPFKAAATHTQPSFYVDGKIIEYVNRWPHLGNIIDVDQSDAACITNRRNLLIGQINDLLCFFGMLDPVVKTELLYTYCSSLYGSVLWDLQLPEIQLVCSVWRTALRRLWNARRNTHNDIINALSGKWPLFEELCRRIINFHFSCVKSSNMIISSLCRYLTSDDCALSPHGRNIRFLCEKYDLSLCSFGYLESYDAVLARF